jgi:hypothetical protein
MTRQTKAGQALRRKARRVSRTWVGRHWPTARQLEHDGAGVDFAGRDHVVIYSYLAGVDPDKLLATLDAIEAEARQPLLDALETVVAAWDMWGGPERVAAARTLPDHSVAVEWTGLADSMETARATITADAAKGGGE